jgi:hypothetical protein
MMRSGCTFDYLITEFYSTAVFSARCLSLIQKKYNERQSESFKIKQIKNIILFGINAIKNEIFSRIIQKEYGFIYTSETDQLLPINQVMKVLNEFILKEPNLTATAYQRLPIESQEELRGALDYIVRHRNLPENEYQNIFYLCSLPIERTVEACMPSNNGFQLLSNKPSFFNKLYAKKNPRDLDKISHDDQLIVRIWENIDKEIIGVSFEVKEYRCKGSLFLSPVFKTGDKYKRIFYNDYISLSAEQVYFHDSLQIMESLNQSLNAILPSVMLDLIVEYLRPTVNALIDTDITSHQSQPAHIFYLSKLNPAKIDPEKIWEFLLDYDDSNKCRLKNPYLVLKNNSDIITKAFYLVMRSITNIIMKDDFNMHFYSLSYKDKVNEFLNILTSIQNKNNETQMIPAQGQLASTPSI